MFTGRDTDVHAERQGSPMGIRLNMGYTGVKQNYSFLFQSMSGNSNLNFLSDYMSIKNGSYGKLMKAYYGKDSKLSSEAASIADEKKKTLSTSKDSAETLKQIQTSSESLKSSADQLTNTGKDSVFSKGQDEIYKAVDSFVTNYNKLIEGSAKSASDSITKRVDTLKNMTESNQKLLSQAGITIGKDDTLTLDRDAFAKADANTVKTLFSGSYSYASRVSSQSSFIDFAATQEAAKANTYTTKGTYSNTYASGNIFNSYF